MALLTVERSEIFTLKMQRGEQVSVIKGSFHSRGFADGGRRRLPREDTASPEKF